MLSPNGYKRFFSAGLKLMAPKWPIPEDIPSSEAPLSFIVLSENQVCLLLLIPSASRGLLRWASCVSLGDWTDVHGFPVPAVGVGHHCSLEGPSLPLHLTEFCLFLFFFETEFRSCYPGWSAMARSRLTATSAS